MNRNANGNVGTHSWKQDLNKYPTIAGATAVFNKNKVHFLAQWLFCGLKLHY